MSKKYPALSIIAILLKALAVAIVVGGLVADVWLASQTQQLLNFILGYFALGTIALGFLTFIIAVAINRNSGYF
jgi:hypothetical protein